VQLTLARCVVRSWRPADADSLAIYANNRKIWINLRDAFPHPYTIHDAREFIRSIRSRSPETTFAIAVGDEAIGSIGFVLHRDVERVSAEIGYWLAEPFWGRGITAEALAAVTKLAVQQHGLTRIFAVPFAWNAASCRVLEKAGYVLEGRLRNSAIKDGRLTDQMQYAYIAEITGPALAGPVLQ
jgi:RimJ/RimL family protein N-acetyltransferase